jgi:hypothetical protein
MARKSVVQLDLPGLPGWVKVHGWIFDLGLSPSSITLYILLCKYGTYNSETETYEHSYPSVPTLAARLNVSANTIRNLVKELILADLIHGTERRKANGSPDSVEYVIRCSSPIDPPSDSEVPPLQILRDPPSESEADLEVLTLNPFINKTPPTPRDQLTEMSDSAGADPWGEDFPEEQVDQIRAGEQEPSVLTSLIGVMPELGRYVRPGDHARVDALVDAALARGVSNQQIQDAIGSRGLCDAQKPMAVLAYRIGALSAVRPVRQAADPCPLHLGSAWDRCPSCKGEVIAGDDPYAGREWLRPDGWASRYPCVGRLLCTV